MVSIRSTRRQMIAPPAAHRSVPSRGSPHRDVSVARRPDRVDSPDPRQSGSPTVEQRASPPPIDGRRRHRRSRVRSRLEHRARNRNRPVDAPNAPRRVERADTGASAAHARRFPTPNPRHRAEAELYSPLPPRDTPLERQLRRTRAHRPLGGPSVRARTAHRRTAA
ncbi:conserved hypothetical protein [Burkholderia pseudomallei 1710a]|uniref:Uncharacterized protein n=5 Tax=pseudomallei group TaxID=111527 RepID=A0A0E1VV24_BURPE|nr:conserved hypothetical protein [Burkholderia pseudomallei 1710a]